MKKLLALAAAFVLALTVTLPAAADIIIEPDDAFYVRHQNECDYVGRSYVANGEKGYVVLYTAPGSIPKGNVVNGERIYVSHKWTDHDGDGTRWAVTQDGDWMQMSDLALIYDYQEFEADFGGEFKPYDGTGGEITKACLYSYPGGVYVWTWDMGEDLSEAFRHIYVDAGGRSWGFIGYYMGRHNQWVCLDDPLDENLGIGEYLTAGQVRNGEGLIAPVQPPVADNTVQNEVQDPQQETIYPPAEKLPPSAALWMIPVVLIIAVVVVTAVIVRKRRK